MEWVHAPGAEAVRTTDRGVLLRLRSGREEWFPLSGAMPSPDGDGWLIAGWIATQRRGRACVDTSSMRPRGR